MTFTWVRGDIYVSVQRGQVANACHAEVGRDNKALIGFQPIFDWVPAPTAEEWQQPDVMRQLADHWLATQQAVPRTADGRAVPRVDRDPSG